MGQNRTKRCAGTWSHAVQYGTGPCFHHSAIATAAALLCSAAGNPRGEPNGISSCSGRQKGWSASFEPWVRSDGEVQNQLFSLLQTRLPIGLSQVVIVTACIRSPLTSDVCGFFYLPAIQRLYLPHLPKLDRFSWKSMPGSALSMVMKINGKGRAGARRNRV